MKTKPLDLRKLDPKAAAQKLVVLLRQLATVMGKDPKEVMLLTPKQSAESGYSRCWRVSWEGGPYDWGYRLSLGGSIFEQGDTITGKPSVLAMDAKKFYLQPHYGNDVGFEEVVSRSKR
jgi:hypothetical protein